MTDEQKELLKSLGKDEVLKHYNIDDPDGLKDQLDELESKRKKAYDEAAKTRIKLREAEQELEALKAQSEGRESEEVKELKKNLKTLESELQVHKDFKSNLLNKRLELIPDEALRAELAKTGSLELVELTLEKVVKASSSVGSGNKDGIEAPDINTMTVDELFAFSQTNPDDYNKLMRESIRSKNG